MPEHTPQSSDRQDRNRTLLWALGFVLIALVAIAGINANAPQAGVYQPQPTPFVIETRRIEILSNNQLFSGNQTCIGVCK